MSVLMISGSIVAMFAAVMLGTVAGHSQLERHPTYLAAMDARRPSKNEVALYYIAAFACGGLSILLAALS